MSLTLIVQLLQALSGTLAQVAPLLAQGQSVLSEGDAAAVHAALLNAEQATAALRPEVDAALAAAARS